MAKEQIKVHAFTLKAKGIASCLYTPIEIAVPQVNFNYNSSIRTDIKGIWDTGATSTVITQKVVDALNLTPTGKTLVNTASESNKLVDTYLVDIFLSNELRVKGVQVTIGTIVDGIDCLIGMDIINLGDFSITNYNQKTVMSFRIPSLHEVDYLNTITAKPYRSSPSAGRNDPCPCGSGKKYKNCHGKP